MTDFASVLRQSLKQRGATTPEERERIYAHARALMIRKLWSMQPPLSSNEIDDNIRNFNTAVDQVEREQAYGRGRVEASPRYNWANGDGRPVPTRPGSGTAPPQPQPPSRPASQRPAPPPAAPQGRAPQHVPPPPSATVTPMPPRNPAPAPRPAAQRPAPTQARQTGPVVAQRQYQPQSQPQTRPQPNFQAPEPIAVGGRNDVPPSRSKPAAPQRERYSEPSGGRAEPRLEMPGMRSNVRAEPHLRADTHPRAEPHSRAEPHPGARFNDFEPMPAPTQSRRKFLRGRKKTRDAGEYNDMPELKTRRRRGTFGRLFAIGIAGLTATVGVWCVVVLYPILVPTTQGQRIQAQAAETDLAAMPTRPIPPARQVLAAPLSTENGASPETAGAQSSPAATQIAAGQPAAQTHDSFVVFDGRDPTVFDAVSENPIQFNGDIQGGFARVTSSPDAPGVRAVVGPGLAQQFAGHRVKIVIVARSSTLGGATSIRLAYESGATLSPWKSVEISDEYKPIELIWDVPADRNARDGDYVLIEPGVPGDGTSADIRWIRIDTVS